MKILLTGADGYIGARLGPFLLERGHEVVGLDTGFYREGWLYAAPGVRVPPCVTADVRQVTEAELAGFDAIVHLAEISNDPLGEHSPQVTYEINYLGTVELARRSQRAGVGRFVYASSCSVYGVGAEESKTEESEAHSQTMYAKCKVLVEQDLLRRADESFSPTVLRNATVYGPSPRMRFDLVLNNLAGLAWTTREIKMVSDGTPWRPLVHVLDVCEAVACCLEAPREPVHGQIFNVGDNQQNYQVKEIAGIVARTFPGCEVTFGASDGDTRSYRVSFDKINTRLPGFRCRRDAVTGANELREVFERIRLSHETFEFRAFTRLRQLTHLIKTGQIDDRYFWRSG